MKVLIHAVGASIGGAVRHLTNFLPELARQDGGDEYVLLVRESFPPLEAGENIRIERVPDTRASGWVARTTYDVATLPRRSRREKFDVIVSLANFGPVWTTVPHVFFQRNSIYYCHDYLSRLKGKLKAETYLRRRLAVESMRRAALVVTPSNAMADMIRRSCPQVRKRRFRTLYHGFSNDNLREPLDSKYQKMLTRGGYKLLYPTHAGLHKGFEVLFEALAELKKRRADFTLFAPIAQDHWPAAIGDYTRQVQSLGIQDHVVFMGNVPQRQMGSLYSQCDLMVYPSLCESFGFSMIEAMGCGLPIVAAGTSVNKEMCGHGAVYYPSLDPRSAAVAINRAMDPEFSRELSVGGRARLNSFDWSWRRYAREFVEMVRGVV